MALRKAIEGRLPSDLKSFPFGVAMVRVLR